MDDLYIKIADLSLQKEESDTDIVYKFIWGSDIVVAKYYMVYNMFVLINNKDVENKEELDNYIRILIQQEGQ